MQLKVKSTQWKKAEADWLVWIVTEENWFRQLEELDKAMGKQLVDQMKKDQFKAKKKTIYSFSTHGKISARKLLIAGVGKQSKVDLNLVRTLIANIARKAKTSHQTSLAINCTLDLLKRFASQDLAKAIVEGTMLGAYSFSKYKTKKPPEQTEIESVALLFKPAQIAYADKGVKMGKIYALATTFARDLVNESPSTTTPKYLADVAKKIAKDTQVKVDILEKSDIEKLGMGAFLSVSKGSEQPPKFIRLSYKNRGKKKIVLAGKAITFDTGGLSLKSSKSMETMKLDMAGAAAVLGAFYVLPKLNLKINVTGLIAACENMPGPAATKPGDVVTAMDGQTIEVLNTDAEGRMTLADVLSFAVKKEKPDQIIDLATLTGACVVALGEEIGGVFSNQKDLSDRLIESGKREGELLWPMPLEENYQDQIKSHIADLRNIGKNRYGGAVTAALFLQKFVHDMPWAHIDIAGPAFYEKNTPLISKGGSGFGVRTVLNYLSSQ